MLSKKRKINKKEFKSFFKQVVKKDIVLPKIDLEVWEKVIDNNKDVKNESETQKADKAIGLLKTMAEKETETIGQDNNKVCWNWYLNNKV